MPLTYDISNVHPDFKTQAGQMHPGLYELLLFSVMIGLGSLTEKNLDEWDFRFQLYGRLHGERMWPRQELRQFLGFSTNVSNETRARWQRRIVAGAASDIHWRIREEKNRESEAAAGKDQNQSATP